MKVQLSNFIFTSTGFLSLLMFFASCSKKDATPAANADAKFSFTSTRNFPVTVHFHNNSTDISTPGFSYRWVFGDGTFSTETHPTHIYTIADTYNVALEETEPFGFYSLGDQVVLNGATPSGTSSRNPGTVTYTITIDPGFEVTFTDQSANASSKHWSFGDGTEADNPGTSFTHVYNANGPFVVQLTATGSGNSDNSSATISF